MDASWINAVIKVRRWRRRRTEAGGRCGKFVYDPVNLIVSCGKRRRKRRRCAMGGRDREGSCSSCGCVNGYKNEENWGKKVGRSACPKG